MLFSVAAQNAAAFALAKEHRLIKPGRTKTDTSKQRTPGSIARYPVIVFESQKKLTDIDHRRCR